MTGRMRISFVLLALGCGAPAHTERQIGPRLGESTASLPANASVPPPDAPGPQNLSVPWNHPVPPGPPPAIVTEPASGSNDEPMDEDDADVKAGSAAPQPEAPQ